MSLYQLIYQSKESSQLSNKDFSDILDVARQNNANLGVTGCLFYNGGWVLQVLEGEQGIVDNLYQKIIRDERHKDCNLMYFEPIDKRVFSKWTMGMINLETERDSKYRELKEAMDKFDSGQVAIPLAIKMFRIFTHDFEPKAL